MPGIFLLPGEFYFGDEYKTIKTLLGSCVAITMWSPHLKIGGMCHYRLPKRLTGKAGALDGNYGDEAFLMFMKHLIKHHLKPKDITVGIFGAGNMFSNVVLSNEKSIGVQNIKLAHQILSKQGFMISHESLGGNVSRKISFDVITGAIKVVSLDANQQKWL